MLHDRYEVKATRGRKILHRAFYEAYEDAINELNELVDMHPEAEIEFRDHKPFDAR